VVSANAGCYTLPLQSVKYPYGLKGTPVADDGLKRLFHVILKIIEKGKRP
jgi:hypothetical protein